MAKPDNPGAQGRDKAAAARQGGGGRGKGKGVRYETATIPAGVAEITVDVPEGKDLVAPRGKIEPRGQKLAIEQGDDNRATLRLRDGPSNQDTTVRYRLVDEEDEAEEPEEAQ